MGDSSRYYGVDFKYVLRWQRGKLLRNNDDILIAEAGTSDSTEPLFFQLYKPEQGCSEDQISLSVLDCNPEKQLKADCTHERM